MLVKRRVLLDESPSYWIYHIPGRKVGCTDNVERRKRGYPIGTKFEILEELYGVTNQEAGDREWWWADQFGYKRGAHYTVTVALVAVRTPEQLSAAGYRFAEFGWKTRTLEQRRDAGLKGGFRQRLICPHCGLEGQAANLRRYHFDHCPKKL